MKRLEDDEAFSNRHTAATQKIIVKHHEFSAASPLSFARRMLGKELVTLYTELYEVRCEWEALDDEFAQMALARHLREDMAEWFTKHGVTPPQWCVKPRAKKSVKGEAVPLFDAA